MKSSIQNIRLQVQSLSEEEMVLMTDMEEEIQSIVQIEEIAWR